MAVYEQSYIEMALSISALKTVYTLKHENGEKGMNLLKIQVIVIVVQRKFNDFEVIWQSTQTVLLLILLAGN